MRGATILLLTSMKLKNGKKEFISSIATTIFLQFVLDSNAILITYGSRLNFTK